MEILCPKCGSTQLCYEVLSSDKGTDPPKLSIVCKDCSESVMIDGKWRDPKPYWISTDNSKSTWDEVLDKRLNNLFRTKQYKPAKSLAPQSSDLTPSIILDYINYKLSTELGTSVRNVHHLRVKYSKIKDLLEDIIKSAPYDKRKLKNYTETS